MARARLRDAGEIDLCWICGLPYVEKMDSGLPVAVAVAPVMRALRYGRAPVYYSDVLVRADSAHRSFGDLKGKRWAYNEPRPHSGFNVVRHHLATLQQRFDFFDGMVEAGSHQSALRMLLAGEVAGAGIDSTVWEAGARSDASLIERVRTVETLGPSPAPPWVFAATVAGEVRENVTRCLAEMHRDDRGASVLGLWGIAELRPVSDAFYDPIRRMARESARLAAV